MANGDGDGPTIVEKTAEELRREIDELHRQQREITDRLRDPRGLRRAGLVQNGPRSLTGVRSRGVVRPADRNENEDQPPAKRRLSSAVVKVGDLATDNRDDGENRSKIQDVNITADEAGVGSNADANSHWASSVADSQGVDGLKRRGNPRFSRLDYSVPTSEHVPRVLPKDEDPSLVKRNRRMLGQLLGTLEKFQQEDKKLSTSEAYMRRSDSLQRAEQRAKEESERLRQQEREQIAIKRRRDLTLRARIAAKAEEKKLELLFIRWSEHHKRLCNFLRTKTEPQIYYLPTRPMESDSTTSDQRKQEVFTEWKNRRRAELTEFQKQISDQCMANVEVELERWQNGGNGRNKGTLENLQETMDKELESHQLEHGPKTRRLPGGDDTIEEDVEDIAAEDDALDDVLGNGENRVANEDAPAVDVAADTIPPLQQVQ
ncbi:protein-protein interaction regulator family protein [Wolffia australiana]